MDAHPRTHLLEGSRMAAVTRSAARAAFGRPLVTNVHRGLLAEAIVAEALQPTWRWCSSDYGAWDFERGDGFRLEVKQSAARQSWWSADAPSPAAAARFDIKARKGRYDGAVWANQIRRWADIYVFAHHPRADDSADHRDPDQWHFYIVPEHVLPAAASIGLSRVHRLSPAYAFEQLAGAVDDASRGLTPSAL